MVRSKYVSAENFLSKYDPRCATEMISTLGKGGLMKADTPTLTIIKHAFGYKTATTFLSVFLKSVAKFHQLADKIDPETMYDIADCIMQEFYYLKASELVVFFQELKTSHFRDRNDEDRGKMYGVFSGQVIMDCLYKFKEERNRYIDEQKAEEQRRKHDEILANAASPEDVKKHLSKIISHGGNSLLESVAVGNGWMTKQEANDARRAHLRGINKDTITEFKKESASDAERRRKNNEELYKRLEAEQREKEHRKNLGL